jgi:hypothetical protein
MCFNNMHALGIQFLSKRSNILSSCMEQYMTPIFIIVTFTQNENCVDISSTEQHYYFYGRS